MVRGKKTCRILKEVRRQIADANGIEFVTSECRYNGDCLGTCPKCEAEVRYLEQRLRACSLAGKAVAIAGISVASFAMLMPMSSQAQSLSHDFQLLPCDSISATGANSVKVRGVVKYEYTTKDNSIATEELIGATVINLTKGKGTGTDIDGKFEIEVCPGDSIRVSFIGYYSETICVKAPIDTMQIVLTEDKSAILGEVVFAGAMPKFEGNHYLDLNVIDEKGNVIVTDYVERIWLDKDGDEDSESLHPEYFDDKHPCRIYWDYESGLHDEDGKPLKEATLRIEAEGYDDPIIIKVKYPKHHAKKTVRFKHKKK